MSRDKVSKNIHKKRILSRKGNILANIATNDNFSFLKLENDFIFFCAFLIYCVEFLATDSDY